MATESPAPDVSGSADRRLARIAAWCVVGVALLIAVMVWGGFFLYPRRIEPAQPIPFSHRVHAGDKQIGCLVCHAGAADTSRAGVPPLETCLLCHARIIVEHPEILKLRAAYDQGAPIDWVQVYDLPEYVYFNHEAHVRQGVDCGVCHGDVRGMDRLVQAHEFNMGFCVQCHRDHRVSHDCLMCHR